MLAWLKHSVRSTINLISVIGVVVFLTYFSVTLFYSLKNDDGLKKLEKQQLPTLLSINNASIHILYVKEFLSS